jgi:hypothetical protein
MPIVTVQQSPRGLEEKRSLVAGITQAFVDAYGVGPPPPERRPKQPRAPISALTGFGPTANANPCPPRRRESLPLKPAGRHPDIHDSHRQIR